MATEPMEVRWTLTSIPLTWLGSNEAGCWHLLTCAAAASTAMTGIRPGRNSPKQILGTTLSRALSIWSRKNTPPQPAWLARVKALEAFLSAVRSPNGQTYLGLL